MIPLLTLQSLSPPMKNWLQVFYGGTLSVWPVYGILVASLSVKYVILHKIGVANRFPSSHASSVLAYLTTLLYQIGIGSSVDNG